MYLHSYSIAVQKRLSPKELATSTALPLVMLNIDSDDAFFTLYSQSVKSLLYLCALLRALFEAIKESLEFVAT